MVRYGVIGLCYTPKMDAFCFLNGQIVPVSQAKVSVYDIGLLRGFGIYEGLRTCNRKPFMLEAHLERFHRSAEKMALKIPATDLEIGTILGQLIEKNVPQGKEGLIRVILTGGTAISGIEYDHETPTFYMLVEEFKPLDQGYLENGCSVTVFDHQRQFPASKTTNYIQTVLLQDDRKKAGALEIMYTSGGKMLEGAGSNFFIVKNRVIATPKGNVLGGITRKVAIDIARPHFAIEERDITVDEMYAADEVFLTSSFKDVVPVVRVGEKTIADGKPGPVTKRVIGLFDEFTRTY